MTEPVLKPFMRGNNAKVLWVPGVVTVQPMEGDRGIIHLGPSVGWTKPDVLSWVVDETIVRRADLMAGDLDWLPVNLPETRIDPSRFPNVYRLAANAPLIAVGRRPPSVPLPYLHINHDPTLVWLRDFGVVGTFGEKPVCFGGMYFSLASGATENDGGWVGVDQLPPIFVQRALLELTGGTVDLNSLGVVLDLRNRIEDHELDSWEAWLREVLARAILAESDAREIARLIAAAGDADAIEIPLFGTARRVQFPAVTLLAGETPSPEFRLTLPETSRWIVEHVAPWTPSYPVTTG
jgi:hypothetical protein